MQPTVSVNGFGSFLRQVQVACEHIFSAHQDFTGDGIQANFVVACSGANRSRAHSIWGHTGRGATGLGHAPDLKHRYTQGQIPAHQIRRNRRSTCHQVAGAVNANEFANIVERQNLRYSKFQFEPSADRLLRQDLFGNGGAHTNRPSVGGLLKGSGLFQ